MGKTQKQVSFPKIWLEEMHTIFHQNENDLKALNINSFTEFLKVAVNLGTPQLEKLVSKLHNHEESDSDK